MENKVKGAELLAYNLTEPLFIRGKAYGMGRSSRPSISKYKPRRINGGINEISYLLPHTHNNKGVVLVWRVCYLLPNRNPYLVDGHGILL